MKKRDTEPIEYRTVRWTIKVTPAEKARCLELAAQAELTEADFIRARVLDNSYTVKNRAPSVNRRELSQALSRLGDLVPELRRIHELLEVGDFPFDPHTVIRALDQAERAAHTIILSLGGDV